MKSTSGLQPVAFLFAGQGNPFIGMGSDLWNINAVTRQIWDCASDISGLNIRQLCQQGPMNRLIQTTVQQLAVTAINVTLYSLCHERLKACEIVGACGHSVGEYSALYAAGAISLETLFRLIHFRAQLMNVLSKRQKGSMMVVEQIDCRSLSALIDCSGIAVEISCDNSPRQQVIGGPAAMLARISQLLISTGYVPVRTGVSGAWHTRLMEEGCIRMRECLQSAEIFSPRYEVLMNVTGKPEREIGAIKENLALHLTHRVQWSASMERLLASASPVRFIEVSPKPYLGNLLRDFSGFSPENAMHCRAMLPVPQRQA